MVGLVYLGGKKLKGMGIIMDTVNIYIYIERETCVKIKK